MNKKLNYTLIASGLLVGMAASPTFAATPFDGPYLGLQLGHSVHDIKVTSTTSTISSNTEGISASGADGGLYTGWGTKISPTTYGGVEAEYSWSGAEHTTTETELGFGTSTANIKEKYNYGLSARLGWLPTSSTMLYGRAGWQRTNIDYSGSLTGGEGNFSYNTNQDHDGWRLGAGAEVALTSDWLLRLDYAHTWYNDETLTPVAGFSMKLEPQHDVFRVGIAHQF